MKIKLNYLTLVIFLLLNSYVQAQNDIIVTTDSKKIDAKILEVSKMEIKYKRSDNIDGPTYVLSTEKINTIIFMNGQVETYQHNATNNNANSQSEDNSNSDQNANDDQTTNAKSGNKLKFNPQPSDKFIVGITVGYVSKTASDVENGIKQSGSFLFGTANSFSPAMRVGMTLNPTFKYGIGVRLGTFLEYAREEKTTVLTDAQGMIIQNAKLTMHDITISLPVQLSYRYEIIPKLSFMIYTGPVFDFGGYSVLKLNDKKVEEYGNLYTYPNGYRGFNVLWGVGGAIQWSRLRIDVGGEFGLMNKSNKSNKSRYNGVISKWNKPIYVTLSVLF